MFEDSINIFRLNGGEKNILEAETSTVKIPRTGIFICTGGWVNVNIDNTNFHMTKDNMIVYFAYNSLHITSHSSMLTGILLGADLETIQPLLYNVTDFNALFVIKQNPLTMLSVERMNRIMMHAQLIEDIIERQKLLFNNDNIQNSTLMPIKEILSQQRYLLGQCIMLEIIASFTNVNNSVSNNIDNRKEDILKKFIESLYKNFRTKHEVNFYAKEQYLSCRYFSSIIKERSGQTPITWISAALLAESKRLILSGTKTMREISDYLYFPNQSYFGKWFKNHTGISPMDFKNGKVPKNSNESKLAKFMPTYMQNLTNTNN